MKIEKILYNKKLTSNEKLVIFFLSKNKNCVLTYNQICNKLNITNFSIPKLIKYNFISCSIDKNKRVLNLFKKGELLKTHKDTLLQFWNKLPNVRKHKEGTNLYKKINKMLNLLKNQKFNLKIDPLFVEKHNLDLSNFPKSEREIKNGLINLSKLLSPEYGYIKNDIIWPDENLKKKFKMRDLGNLIYNPLTGSSLFLLVFQYPPIILKDLIDEETKKIINILSKYININNKLKLKYYIKDLIKFFENIQSKNYKNDVKKHNINNLFLSNEEFIEYFCNWINNEVIENKRKISINHLNIKGTIINKFKEYLKDKGVEV